ncbi:cotranscriptional regulator ARB2A isoform X1 [Callorhinus ursinus]|uniref:cotranscriptional regulator ARB2A isoform X1 n=2 Tax=Callorhinus ursinus TaxID=34884 RepID=UPI003CD02A19
MSISLSSLILLPIWISMAQIQQGGPDEKEKTTALKDLLSRIDLDELMKKDEPPLDFPDTLEGFEYAFNEKGQLRHIKTGEPFVFNYREDLHRWNQKRYEALGEIITKYVYELLEKDCNLKKISIPVDATESEPKSFIFMSEDALTNPQKLMVLIHGSGVVRAGQWARRLIINEDLDSGTQIPFIKRAMDEGYGVIVLNPNENYIEVEKPKIHVQSSSDSSDEPAEKRERKDKVSKETKKRRDFYEKYRNPQREKEMMQLYIRENGSPEEHAIYVWDHFIAQSAAENVFFVAHSYGGLAFVELMIQREADVKSKVTAVALTDSVHNVWHQEAGKTIREWMRENCCNWVSSSEPLDTSVESMLPDCPRVSAAVSCSGSLKTLPYGQIHFTSPPGFMVLSQTTICRFESQQLSLTNMWKLRPLLKMWLEEVDTKNFLGLCKMEMILQQARKQRRASRESRIRNNLEQLFLQCPKPTPQQISCIAGQLRLQKELVRVWFYNRSKMGGQPTIDFSPPEDVGAAGPPFPGGPVCFPLASGLHFESPHYEEPYFIPVYSPTPFPVAGTPLSAPATAQGHPRLSN